MTNLGKNGSVEFRFYRPGAGDVRVTGSFDQWREPKAMRPDGHGWWVLTMELEPGEYQFRYVADGVWYTDFAAHGVEITKFGWNSVLVVPGKGLPALRPGYKGNKPAAQQPAGATTTQDDNRLLVA